MDNALLSERMWDGLAHLQRLLGRHTPGARLMDRDGYVASVIGAVPHASIPNAVVSLDPAQVLEDLDELGRSYVDAGVSKWGVWIDGDEREATGELAARGLVLDSVPAAMGAFLDEIDLGGTDGNPEPQRADGPTVGRVNDLAYGYGENGPLTTVIGGLPADAAYATRCDVNGSAASVMLAGDHREDTAVWFVATIPEARHQGLASRLLRHALARAKQRGQTSTTLQASQKGQGVYARLGYGNLGRLELWEMRS
jgi:ribosomal protein S18 acetylase RimI-like enzyme